MDTDSFIIHIKTEYFYKDIADDVKKCFDTSNYSEDDKRPIPRGMKDELGGKIWKELVAFRPKTHSYLTDDDKNIKKAKGTKKCVIKRIFQFNDYENCLFKNEIILKSQQRFKSEAHYVYTEEIDKIGPSSNDDKRLQTFDKITTYPYGASAFKVCEREMLSM